MEINFLGSLREEAHSLDLLAEVCHFPVCYCCPMDLDGGEGGGDGTDVRSHKQLPQIMYLHPAWPRTGCQDLQTLVQLVHFM